MAQHLAPHRLAAGEKDLVEFLLQKGLVLGPAAGDHKDVLRREALGQNGADHLAGGGRVGAGLDHRGVAGGQRVDQRLQRQHQRVVPGAHDQGDAVGGGALEAAGRKLRDRRVDGFVPHQPGQVAAHPGKLRQRHAGLAHIAFHPAFAQVGFQRRVDVGLVAQDGGFQVIKHFGAKRPRQRFARQKEFPLLLHHLCDLLLRHWYFPPFLA